MEATPTPWALGPRSPPQRSEKPEVYLGAFQKAQTVKVLAAKEELRPSGWTETDSRVLSSDFYMCTVIHTHTYEVNIKM